MAAAVAPAASRARAWVTVTYAFAAGCLVGPRYDPPPPPAPVAGIYKEAGTWKLANPRDTLSRGAWWTMFREPELDALQARLNVNNQSIAVAIENYKTALAQVRAARSQYFPTVSAVPTWTWGRSSGVSTRGTSTATTGFTGVSPTGGTTSVGPFAAYVAPLVASWAPDLFGRVRYTVRQREYGAQVSAADLESTRLLAQSMLAQVYFQARGQDALQELLDATVATNQEVVTLTRQRFNGGLETESAVVQAELTLENSRVQATNAGILRAQYEHAIATLLAVPATDFRLAIRAELPAPPTIPIGTPSQLLERRPDIAAAERQMAIANAAIGFAYTAYFPTVTLSGQAGFASNMMKTLFSWPRRIWAVGLGVSETLFDAGLRRANVEAAEATYNATVASYRQTVLAAFQQVEDLLAQMRINERSIEQQRNAVALAQHAFELERARYEAGLDPYINLMLQQTAVLAARQVYVSLKVEQMAWAVQLVQALGGGWDRSLLPAP